MRCAIELQSGMAERKKRRTFPRPQIVFPLEFMLGRSRGRKSDGDLEGDAVNVLRASRDAFATRRIVCQRTFTGSRDKLGERGSRTSRQGLKTIRHSDSCIASSGPWPR